VQGSESGESDVNLSGPDPSPSALPVDAERRFGGLRRLYGDDGYDRVRACRVAVVGLGGVGSWAVEALARSGVAALVLIDLDHVAESNVNRQIQATSDTLGQAKGQALADRVKLIHPDCQIHLIDDFVTPDNWPDLLAGQAVDALIDACDQVHAKTAMAAWARANRLPFVTVGAAGGKRAPQRVEVADLSEVTHDPLLASLRQRLRKAHQAPRQGKMAVTAVFSREPVLMPKEGVCDPASKLACHGYGSSVTVTATFGMTAAAVVLEACMA
jgi:tRNA threonylcarbamoyladenosine dehydratase